MAILFPLTLHRATNHRTCLNKLIISSHAVCEDNRNPKELVYVIKLLSGSSKFVYRQHRKHDADVKIVIHIIYKVHVNCELKKPECDKIVGHI